MGFIAKRDFKRLPRRLVTELVCTAVFWISTPRSEGIHPTLSPRAIMSGHPLTNKSVEFQFGNFVQATEPPKTSNSKNTMDERTSDAIYCRPSGNHQGGFWVYKLSTTQLVHRNSAKPAHSSGGSYRRERENADRYHFWRPVWQHNYIGL